MAQIINLRQKRKAKARDDQRTTAEQNRAKHGRSKVEIEQTKLEIKSHERHLSGHKLTDCDE